MNEIQFKNLNIGDIVECTYKQSPDYGRKFKLVKYLRYAVDKSTWVESTKEEFMSGKELGSGYAYFEPLDGKKIFMSYSMKHSNLYEETQGIGRRFKNVWIEKAE